MVVIKAMFAAPDLPPFEGMPFMYNTESPTLRRFEANMLKLVSLQR